MSKAEQELERLRKIAEANKELQELEKPESYVDVMSRVMGKQYVPVTGETPYESVVKSYELPFPLYEFQQKSVNELGPEPKTGLYFQPGTGKTATSTAMALFRFISELASRCVVIMPPILLDQWEKFLGTIPNLTVMKYRGTPKVRRDLNLGQAQFTLVGLQIFKRDYDRFVKEFGPETVVILDEAHSIKNVSSDNHKKYSRFVMDKAHILLTGTPLSTPEDGYSYVKLLAPSVYRNKAQFMNLHAGERDFFQQVVSWKNLDLLKENMELNAHRVLKEDVLGDLPEVQYDPIFYRLEPGHAALYKKLAEEQLLQFEDGSGKIDATSTGKLFHALGQIVCNYGYFAGDDKKRSTCYDLLDNLMDELGDEKLIIFAVYRMTNESLLAYMQKYGAVAAFGGQTSAQNLNAVQEFINNPKCRAFIAQPTTAGIGVDGLQDVCRDAIFLELPSVRDFEQGVSRLHRSGQKRGVHIRLAVAEGTLQVRSQARLLERDSTINKVIRNKQDLREAIYGN